MSNKIFHGLNSEEIFHLKEIFKIWMHNTIGVEQENGFTLVNYGKREEPNPIIDIFGIKLYFPVYLDETNLESALEEEGPFYKSFKKWCDWISSLHIDDKRVDFIKAEPEGSYSLGSYLISSTRTISSEDIASSAKSSKKDPRLKKCLEKLEGWETNESIKLRYEKWQENQKQLGRQPLPSLVSKEVLNEFLVESFRELRTIEVAKRGCCNYVYIEIEQRDTINIEEVIFYLDYKDEDLEQSPLDFSVQLWVYEMRKEGIDLITFSKEVADARDDAAYFYDLF